MASTINADNGVSSGSAGVKTTADSSGVLALQTNGTTAVTVDTSQNVGIGTTSPGATLELARTSADVGLFITRTSTGAASYRQFIDGDGDIRLNMVSSKNMRFFTADTERARITSGGELLVNRTATSSGAVLAVTGTNNNLSFACWNNGNSEPNGIEVYYSAAAPNGTANRFFNCLDTGATRASIRSNGGLANYQANNVDLSDARTKKDITPAASMWGKVAALEIVTYKYNDQTHDDVNLGVIAQQVEAVEPVWVDSDGWGDEKEGEEPLKTVYTKDITFAAIKALQEAMARIEKLEAEVAALKAR